MPRVLSLSDPEKAACTYFPLLTIEVKEGNLMFPIKHSGAIQCGPALFPPREYLQYNFQRALKQIEREGRIRGIHPIKMAVRDQVQIREI